MFGDRLAPVIPIFGTKQDREIDRNAYLLRRVADLETEIALLESEKQRLNRILGDKAVTNVMNGEQL